MSGCGCPAHYAVSDVSETDQIVLKVQPHRDGGAAEITSVRFQLVDVTLIDSGIEIPVRSQND